MKRVVLAVISTVAALVLVLSFKTHSPSAVATPPAAVSANSTTGSPTTGSDSNSSTAKTKTKTKSKTTYTGGVANTRYGPVQVQITVTSGKVARADAVVYPTNDPRDLQINSYAIPQLNAEATSASSASIDMISGATFTSAGYIASLQSAIDQAGL